MPAYLVDFKYKNDIEVLDAALYVYSKTVLKNELSEKRRIILREYLLYGYTEQTKDGICRNLNMDRRNLNTQNHNLQKMGFLKPHPTTQKLKLVSEDLLRLKETVLSTEGKKVIMINFSKQ